MDRTAETRAKALERAADLMEARRGRFLFLLQSEGKKTLVKIVKLVDAFRVQTDVLAAALDHSAPSVEKHAKFMRDKVVPAMVKLRELGDQIELLAPHTTWPLPTYREMLFIK